MKQYYASEWEQRLAEGAVAYLTSGTGDRSSDQNRCCPQFGCPAPCPPMADPTGPTGPQGIPGPDGPMGPTGPAGTCVCTCRSMGELVRNGGMEHFQNGLPVDWTTNDPEKIAQVTAQGRVHTGNFAVNLSNGGELWQDVSVTGGCYYEFSFFARGEGAQVAVQATVTFLDGQGMNQNGLTISIGSQDLPNSNREFGYYRGITGQAPTWATMARLRFAVTANGGQSADLDDVSFSVN